MLCLTRNITRMFFHFPTVPVIVSSVLKTINVTLTYEVVLLRNVHDYLVVVNMLMSFNSATNFIIYVICGTEFRNTVKGCLKWSSTK